MANGKKKLSEKTKWILYGAGGFLVLLIGLVLIFGTPSAESVFKDMNDTMLKTKSVTVDQTMAVTSSSGDADIKSSLYMDMNSSTNLLAKGTFSLNMTSDSSPITVSGDVIRIGSSDYVKYSNISSTDSSLESSFSQVDAKLKDNWIKVRTSDQFASLAQSPLKFTTSVLPTPYANLSDSQRKTVVDILQDKTTYTIDESSKVDVGGVSAYKYSISYNHDQYKKVVSAITGFVSYFKDDSSSGDSQIKSLTVWVDISTKQIIKIEFTGTSTSGDVTGTISFSGYNQVKTVEKPADYFIESELLQ